VVTLLLEMIVTMAERAVNGEGRVAIFTPGLISLTCAVKSCQPSFSLAACSLVLFGRALRVIQVALLELTLVSEVS